MTEMFDCIREIMTRATPDGWISFIGSIIGALITVLSIVVAVYINNRQEKRQKKSAMIPYYEALLQSLPSYDKLMTQADYLDFEDNLLGTFTSAEDKLSILERALANAEEDAKGRLEYKVHRHKEYLEYWNAANEKIENFIGDGYYNAIKSSCDVDIIICYYDFLSAFHNEHYYSGPVINSDILRWNLSRLMDAINRAKK